MVRLKAAEPRESDWGSAAAMIASAAFSRLSFDRGIPLRTDSASSEVTDFGPTALSTRRTSLQTSSSANVIWIPTAAVG